MKNSFINRSGDLSGVPVDYIPVTPGATHLVGSNGGDEVAIGLYIEVGGSVTVTTANGISRTINVPDYHYLVLGVSHVTAATASGIHALVGV